MSTVTKASLESKIRRLEMFEQSQDGQLRLSLNEEYQLAAYRMLLTYIASCAHGFVRDKAGVFRCEKCGASWGDGITQQRENDLLIKRLMP